MDFFETALLQRYKKFKSRACAHPERRRPLMEDCMVERGVGIGVKAVVNNLVPLLAVPLFKASSECAHARDFEF